MGEGHARREEQQVQRWRWEPGSAVSSQRHEPVSPQLALSSSLPPPVRLMAPDSLQVTQIGTHRCNITWAVPESSHYIQRYLEFEARTRSPGQSWEVSTGPSLCCPLSSFLSWSPCPSSVSAEPQQPPRSPCGSSVSAVPACPSCNPGVPAGGRFQAGTRATFT